MGKNKVTIPDDYDYIEEPVIRESNIQWFPGHMAKAKRLLSENIGLVDIVVEIIDARIPFSSRNPEFDSILGSKPRVIVANKKDLADDRQSAFWKQYYADRGVRLVYSDSKNGNGVKDVLNAVMAEMEEKLQHKAERGIKTYTVKMMVAGIPNVGKSSFINKVAGRNVAVTGDKPGVTRGKQWLRVSDSISLLDTPGLLWPKFDDQNAAFKLACTGAIKDDILDRSDIAAYLLLYLLENYPGVIEAKYKVEEKAFYEEARADIKESEKRAGVGQKLLDACAKKRGCLLKGGITDTERICTMILDDFRGGKLGKISLDSKKDLGDSQ